MTWMLTWIQACWVTLEKGMKNPDFILNTSQIGTSASMGVDIRAKVNYYKKKRCYDQVVIEKGKRKTHVRMDPEFLQ